MSQEQPSRSIDEDGHLSEETAAVEDQTSEPAANKIQKPSSSAGQNNSNNISVMTGRSRTEQRGTITIGEALEATALTAGHRPVDYSDAAAIQAAEVRATGRTNIVPGGIAAAAQSAATRNARVTRDEDKTKLADILTDASSKLPADKPVTRRDAEGVIGAELRNDPNLCTRPGGVAASLAAAARLNQTNSQANMNKNQEH